MCMCLLCVGMCVYEYVCMCVCVLTETCELKANCTNQGQCDKQTGICSCYDGYHGINCDLCTCMMYGVLSIRYDV